MNVYVSVCPRAYATWQSVNYNQKPDAYFINGNIKYGFYSTGVCISRRYVMGGLGWVKKNGPTSMSGIASYARWVRGRCRRSLWRATQVLSTLRSRTWLRCGAAGSPAAWTQTRRSRSPTRRHTLINDTIRYEVAEWLACWTQAQKDLGSNRSRDAVG